MAALLSQMEEPGSSLPLPSCHLGVIAITCSVLLSGFKETLLPFSLLFMWSSSIMAFPGVSECHADNLLDIPINETVSSLEVESPGLGALCWLLPQTKKTQADSEPSIYWTLTV